MESKPTLREQVAQILAEMTLKIMTGEGNSTDYVSQITNLLKEELEGVTVIGDGKTREALNEYWELYRDLWNEGIIDETDFDSGYDYWNKEAQLSHTKNELKEKMG